MSRKRVWDDAAKLERPGMKVRCVDVGETVVLVLESYSPPASEAFVPGELTLSFMVPVAYPDAQPDPSGFYVLPKDIKLALNGKEPASSSEADWLGAKWRKFSWALKTVQWDPEKDTLETTLATIEKRFLRRA